MPLHRKSLKSPRSRLKKIDKFFSRFGYILLVLFAVYFVVSWITERVFVRVAEVSIVGTHSVSSDEVSQVIKSTLNQKVLYRVRRDNKFLFPIANTEKQIATLSPRIAHVRVTFPSRKQLLVSITEYSPDFLYCLENEVSDKGTASSSEKKLPQDCYFANEKGYVYAHAPEYIGYPFVALIASTSEKAVSHESPIGRTVLDVEKYARIRTFIDDLSRIGLEAHTATLLSEGDIRVEVGMPWAILFSVNKDPERSIKNLTVVLSKLDNASDKGRDVRVIDLRFGNKIFYK